MEANEASLLFEDFGVELMPPLLSAWVHNLSPFIFRVTGNVGLRWYGMAYLAGALVGYLIILRISKQGRTPLKPADVSTFCMNMLIGAFIGGRLGYCLFYDPKLFGFISQFPYWGVLALNQGGMASHGGMVGMIVAGWLFARKACVPLMHLLDLACFAGPLGIFFGRIANFINGELYGRSCADAPWAVKFPQEIYQWDADKMMELTPIVTKDLGVDIATWFRWIGDPVQWSRELFQVAHQIVDAVQSGNSAVTAQLEPLLTPRYPSQLIQAGLEGLLVFVVLAFLWRRPMKPGIVTATFGALYAIMRIVGEQFRLPDAEIGYQWLGLTRGQWLSVGLLAFAFAMLAVMLWRPVPKLPGWAGPTPTSVGK